MWKKITYIALGLLFFVGFGEALYRFDRATAIFSSQQKVELENEAAQTDLMVDVLNGTFIPDSSSLRLLIIGDSHFYGHNIDVDSSFAKVLEQELNKVDLPFEQVVVLDGTRPGNNTFTNTLDYYELAPKFQPQVTLLLYNTNDVYGIMEKKESEQDSSVKNNLTENADANWRNRRKAKSEHVSHDFWLQVYKDFRLFIGKSVVINKLVSNVNLELRLRGIVLPKTEFHHMITKSHTDYYYGWKMSKQHLAKMAQDIHNKNDLLVVYIVPQMNMVQAYHVLDTAENRVVSLCDSLDIPAFRGFTPYADIKNRDLYRISKYDSHPSIAAHKKSARHLADELTPILLERFGHKEGTDVIPD